MLQLRSLLVAYKLASKSELPSSATTSCSMNNDALLLEAPVDQGNGQVNLGLDFVLKDVSFG